MGVTFGYFFIIFIFMLIFVENYGQSICPGGIPPTFAKVPSMVPKLDDQPSLLYATTRGTAITAECYNRCRESNECAGFIVDYERASCFKVTNAENLDDLIPAHSSNYFRKICIRVPSNCTQRAWPIEYSINSELIGLQGTVIPNVADRWQCAQLCLTGTTQYRYGQTEPCYSAQYQSWSGSCAISTENRRSQPEAFGTSLQPGTDYIENECIADVERGSCWHEPIINYTLTQIDLQIPNIDFEQCRDRCEKEQYFNCRGFTYKKCENDYDPNESTCYLHSDDATVAGPLVLSYCTTYVERLTCIDLKVECSDTNMIVTLNYHGFHGRIYAVGHSEECSISGRGDDITTFVMPISSDNRVFNRCGVALAYSRGYGDRRLASNVIVVQRHPIIQTLADRVIKVSCYLDEPTGRLPRPLFNNITLDASFEVAEPPVQTSITNEGYPPIENITPNARLRILDISRGGVEATEAVLGEQLELRVDIYSPFNVSMLRAGHLVASSGDGRESHLLLDWRGCPPDPTVFPALTPTDSHTLSAIFKAFRFPSSPILRFSLILTICEVLCQPTDCGNGLTSWGKRKRRDTSKEDGEDKDADKNKEQDVSLQLAIIIRTPTEEEIKNATLESSAPQYLSQTDDLFCASWPTMMMLLLAFGFLQILLLGMCCFVLHKRKQKLPDQINLQSDFQPRHVTWADNNNVQ